MIAVCTGAGLPVRILEIREDHGSEIRFADSRTMRIIKYRFDSKSSTKHLAIFRIEGEYVNPREQQIEACISNMFGHWVHRKNALNDESFFTIATIQIVNLLRLLKQYFNEH